MDKKFNNKREFFFYLVTLIFLLLFIIYFKIQILNHDYYLSIAGQNSIRSVLLKAPRGLILDRNSKKIVTNLYTTSVKILPGKYENVFNVDLFYDIIYAADKRSKIDINQDSFIEILQRSDIHPSTVLSYVDLKTKGILMENITYFPGLIFSSNPSRHYLDSLRLSHVLGYLRPVKETDIKKGYRKNDVIGTDGVEKIYESVLKGSDGYEDHIIDAHGRDLGIAKHTMKQETVSGKDIILTIDYDLQLKAEALLDGYRGVIICMDPTNGDVLTMANSPDFSLKNFIGPLKYTLWDKWNDSKDKPLVNRATKGEYAPGSIFKIIGSFLFLESPLFSNQETIECKGKISLEDQSNPDHPHIFSCWKKDGHGKMNLRDAIKHSCNVFFYEKILLLQDEDDMILDTWYQYAQKFGFGKKTGIDLYEGKGKIPDIAYMYNNPDMGGKRGSLPNLIIGQGETIVTPIQIIQLMNLIAMDGKGFRPRLNLQKEVIPFNVDFISYYWDFIKDALFSVINEEGGTAYNTFKVKEYDIWGKTGTVEIKTDYKEGEEITVNSWFVGYVEKKNKKMSICVLLEGVNQEDKKYSKEFAKILLYDYAEDI